MEVFDQNPHSHCHSTGLQVIFFLTCTSLLALKKDKLELNGTVPR